MAIIFILVMTPGLGTMPNIIISKFHFALHHSLFLKMEYETLHMVSEIKELIKIYTERLYEIENLLQQNKKQRPYNIPKIKDWQKEHQTLEINIAAFKDRLNKLDGFF